MVGENVGVFFLFGTKKTTNNELVPGTTSSIQFQPSVASQSFTPSKVNLKKTEQYHTILIYPTPFFRPWHSSTLRHVAPLFDPCPPNKKMSPVENPHQWYNQGHNQSSKASRHLGLQGSSKTEKCFDASETQGEDRNGSPLWKEFWCSYSYLDIFKTHLSL